MPGRTTEPQTGPIDFGAVGPFMLSPMAAFTSWPFRRLCQGYGAAFSITEMAKARHIVQGGHRAETDLLITRHPDEQWVGAQVVGADPEELSIATDTLAERGFDFVDLNASCPSRRIRATGAGGSLSEDPAGLGRLIEALQAGGLPVTVKIRSGPAQGPHRALEAAAVAQQAGAAALFFHARNTSERYGSDGAPDHRLSQAVVEAVALPVFVGGGVDSAARAVQILQETGAAGVMMARGAIGNPFIFREAAALLRGETPIVPSVREIVQAVRQLFDGLIQLLGERRACRRMRTELDHYGQLCPEVAVLRTLRRTLERQEQLLGVLHSLEHSVNFDDLQL